MVRHGAEAAALRERIWRQVNDAHREDFLAANAIRNDYPRERALVLIYEEIYRQFARACAVNGISPDLRRQVSVATQGSLRGRVR